MDLLQQRHQQIRLYMRHKKAVLKTQISNLDGHREYYQKLVDAELTRKPIAYRYKTQTLQDKLRQYEKDIQRKMTELETYDTSESETED
jgi:transposase